MNIRDIQLVKIHELSKIIISQDAKWICDCLMEPYLELAEDIVNRIWRDYFKLKCWDPPEYRGRLITDMAEKGHLDLFIIRAI
jgi:hypothetical protein